MYAFIFVNAAIVMAVSHIPYVLERRNLSYKEALKCYLSWNLTDYDGTWGMDKGMMSLAIIFSPLIFIFIFCAAIIMGLVFLITLPFKKVIEDENDKKRKKRGWLR